MLCKCCWIVLYIVHVIYVLFRGGGVFFPDTVYVATQQMKTITYNDLQDSCNSSTLNLIFCATLSSFYRCSQ